MKNILKSSIIIFLAAVIFTGCPDSISPEEEYTVTGSIALDLLSEEGAYPAEYLQNQFSFQSESSRNAVAGFTSDSYSFDIEIFKKEEDNSYTLFHTEEGFNSGSFSIKLPAGTWKLAAEVKKNNQVVAKTSYPANSEDSTPDDRTEITIGKNINGASTNPSFLSDIIIKVKSTMTEDGNHTGTVNLEIKNQCTDLKSVCINWKDGVNDFYQSIDFDWNEGDTEKTVFFTMMSDDLNNDFIIKPGRYEIWLYFYNELKNNPSKSCYYTCTETINVFDNLETNVWVKNSTAEHGSSFLTLLENNNTGIPNAAEFIVDQACRWDTHVFYVNDAASLYNAIPWLTGLNAAIDSEERPEFVIYLKNNIGYNYSSLTEGQNCSQYSNDNYRILSLLNYSSNFDNFDPNHVLNLTICGLNGPKTINFFIDNPDDYDCAQVWDFLYIGENVNLTLKDIEIKNLCRAVNYKSENSSLSMDGKVIIKDNDINVDIGNLENKLTLCEGLTQDSKIGIKSQSTGVFTQGKTLDSSTVGIFSDDDNRNIELSDGNAAIVDENEGTITVKCSDDVSFEVMVPYDKRNGSSNSFSTNSLYYDKSNSSFYCIHNIRAYLNIKSKLGTDFNDSLNDSMSFSITNEQGEELFNETNFLVENLIENSAVTGKCLTITTSNGFNKDGKYCLTVKTRMNGNCYAASFDFFICSIKCSIENKIIPVNSTGDDARLHFNWYLDYGTGRIYDLADSNIINSSNGKKAFKDVSYIIEYYDFHVGTVNKSTIDLPNLYVDFSEAPFNNSTPKVYSVTLKFKHGSTTNIGPCCYVTIGEPRSYFFAGSSVTASNYSSSPCKFNFYNSAKNLCAAVASNNDGLPITIYLLEDIQAANNSFTDVKYKLPSATEAKDFGNSFLYFNNVTNAPPLNVTIKSYGNPTTPYKINLMSTSQGANGGTTISDKGRVLFIGQNANVTLDNVNLVGGYLSSTGETGNGGAVYLSSNSTLNITGGTIIGKWYETNATGNVAPVQDAESSYNNAINGSAVYLCSNSVLNMDSGFIRGDYTGSDSGAVHVSDGARVNITSNGIFGYGNGRILYFENATEQDVLKNFTIYRNEVNDYGVIRLKKGNLVLNNVSIKSCQKTSSDNLNGVSKNAAAFYVDGDADTSLTLNDCVLYNCYSVNNNNGCIYFYDSNTNSNIVLNLNNTLIFRNYKTENNQITAYYNSIYAKAGAGKTFTINMSGETYIDGDVYLCADDTDGVNNLKINIAGKINLPTAASLQNIMSTFGSTDPEICAPIKTSFDPENKQLLDGKIKYVSPASELFTVKSTDAECTAKNYKLDSRGKVILQ